MEGDNLRYIYSNRKFKLKGGFSGSAEYLEYDYTTNEVHVISGSIRSFTTAYDLDYLVKSVLDGRWEEIE